MAVIKMLIGQAALAMSLGPSPFPVFLKEGFSSVLEFEEAPVRVVLGDQNQFQIEKVDRSIAIKPLVPYATTNMFVYFKTKDPRLFVLTASDDVEPTFFKKFETIVPPSAPIPTPLGRAKTYTRTARVLHSEFDKKKDYLSVDFEVSADSQGKVLVDWERVRLRFKDRFLVPSKLWSERREVQRDSAVRGRLVFMKPNLPGDLRSVSIHFPIKGTTNGLSMDLRGKGR